MQMASYQSSWGTARTAQEMHSVVRNDRAVAGGAGLPGAATGSVV